MNGRFPVELRFVYRTPEGPEMVQTGIYLFNTSTLQQVADLAMRCDEVPEYIELDIAQFARRGEDDDEEI